MENTTYTEATTLAAPFVIDSESRAEWFLAKLAAMDAERERITANAAKRAGEITADRERLMHQFGDQLTAWARQEADTRRRKTVTMLHGSVSFRTVPARFTVADAALATESARTACPDAVSVEAVERLDHRALLDYVEASGDVLPGIELHPASESVSIKPGAKE
ncbi:MAG: host-nuclease inhibitor Gam family protein [Armatimonadetes bacterium]|nr:host-nuclease inhibitor Gam family protein [Armatimonadota bacterium]